MRNTIYNADFIFVLFFTRKKDIYSFLEFVLNEQFIHIFVHWVLLLNSFYASGWYSYLYNDTKFILDMNFSCHRKWMAVYMFLIFSKYNVIKKKLSENCKIIRNNFTYELLYLLIKNNRIFYFYDIRLIE